MSLKTFLRTTILLLSRDNVITIKSKSFFFKINLQKKICIMIM